MSCHGLIEFGFLRIMSLPSFNEFVKSVINLSEAPSPGPKTFPDLTVEMLVDLFSGEFTI